MAEKPETDTERIAKLERLVQTHSAALLALLECIRDLPGFDADQFNTLLIQNDMEIQADEAEQRIENLLRRLQLPSH